MQPMKETIRDRIVRFVAAYPEICETKTSWREPLVGFASADDPGFAVLKDAVSESHAMPEDVLPGARSAVNAV